MSKKPGPQIKREEQAVERPTYIGTNMRYQAPQVARFQGAAVGYRPEPKRTLPVVQPNRV